MEKTPHLKKMLDRFISEIDNELVQLSNLHKTPLFYDPIYYINSLSGKRLRPLFTMICAGIYGCPDRESIYAATAIEMLHNFTLVHDDIMDNDQTRRGQPTVHVKWDVATAILAGDALIGLAYQKLLQSPKGNLTEMTNAFTQAMIEICAGQALDKTFETRDAVSEKEYLEMIDKKTAVLISMACKMGGLCAEADETAVQNLAAYGYNIGMGFQIQDDVLDIFADEEKLGKKVGSDLAMNKKTIFTVNLDKGTKIPQDLEAFRNFVEENGLLDRIKNQYQQYFDKAYDLSRKFPENEYLDGLLSLTELIKNRDK